MASRRSELAARLRRFKLDLTVAQDSSRRTIPGRYKVWQKGVVVAGWDDGCDLDEVERVAERAEAGQRL